MLNIYLYDNKVNKQLGCDRPIALWFDKTVGEPGSSHPSLIKPEQLPGPLFKEPASCKDGTAGRKESVMDKSKVFVGIDVSKARLDVGFSPSSKKLSFANSDRGAANLASHLRKTKPELVVVEATGGLEMKVAASLAASNLPVAVVNPRQVRDFAKACGKLAKTDAIDAEVLAEFAKAIKPKVRELPDSATQEIKALVTRRKQIVEMLTAEKNRLARASQGVASEIKAHIKWLETRLKKIDDDLSGAIQESPIWKEKDNLLKSMPGVGRIVSFTILANLPELGTLNRKQIAALVGVAPYCRDSGTFRGKRTVWGGRANVRSTLYMGTLSAIRCNQTIKQFYQRLIKAGKAPKVAITACMRKLLTILNSMVKHNTPWQSQTIVYV